MLLHEVDRLKIAATLKREIGALNIAEYDDGHRTHLGASLMGEKCNRYLWYVFRWVFQESFKDPETHARMQRLFDRGHKEELRFIEWLKAIGVQVWETDPANGEQWRINGHEGHFGGSLDGTARLPERFNYPDAILLEFKTHNTKSFSHLVNTSGGKVKQAKPKHFAQMSIYGFRYGMKYGLYNASNKNDDDIHLELVELDWQYGEELIKRAGDIIIAHEPPPRLHETPTHIDCKFCAASEVCHNGAAYERNCRSCQFAVPAPNKEWHCSVYNNLIPKDFIPVGCDRWQPIGRQK